MIWSGVHHHSPRSRREVDHGRFLPLRPARQLAVRIGLWGLVGLGGVGGVVGLLGAPSPHATPDMAVTSEPRVPADVAGFAQLAVGTWLGAGPDTTGAVNGLFALDPAPNAQTGDSSYRAKQLATIAGRQLASSYWAVTVAATVEVEVGDGWRPAGIWFLEIGVLADDTGLTAAAEPALVPAPPSPGLASQLDVATLTSPGPDQRPLLNAAEGFLRALLVGDGDIDRYLAPSVDMAPVPPPPFTELRLEGVAVADERDVTRVRVAVSGVSVHGASRSLGYELTLRPRDGRWEVVAVSGAPALRSKPTGVSSPTSTSSVPVSTTTVAAVPGV